MPSKREIAIQRAVGQVLQQGHHNLMLKQSEQHNAQSKPLLSVVEGGTEKVYYWDQLRDRVQAANPKHNVDSWSNPMKLEAMNKLINPRRK